MCYYCKALALWKSILYSGVKYFLKTSLSYGIKQSRILGIPAATWLACHRQQVGFSGMEPVRGWGQVTPAISHLPHSWPRRWGMLGDRRLQGKLSISFCPWWWSLGQNSRPHTLRGLSSSSHAMLERKPEPQVSRSVIQKHCWGMAFQTKILPTN